MASSSKSTEKYPYPKNVKVSEHVPDTLSGSNYQQWKQQMETLITKENMVGFIDGTTKAPARKVIVYGREIENKEYESWKKSNDLVRKWIRDTITDGIKIEVKRVWTAKGLWTRRFEKWYGTATASAPAFVPAVVAPAIANRLHKAAIKGDWGDWDEAGKLIEEKSVAVRAGIREYKETGLIVAVKSKKRNDFVKDLSEKMSALDIALYDTRNRTALHRAAGADNREITEKLVEMNPYLPNAKILQARIPLYFAATRGCEEMVLYLLSVTRDESSPMSSPSSLSRLLSAKPRAILFPTF